jgi:UrcA family protein
MTCKLFAVASACAFLGAAFAGTPSFAQDDQGQIQYFAHGEYAQMIVGTGGLDLQSDEGARSALGRIKYAATVFCDDTEGKMDIGRKLEARICKDRMTYLAVSQLDAPLVTARYYETGGKPPVHLANR